MLCFTDVNIVKNEVNLSLSTNLLYPSVLMYSNTCDGPKTIWSSSCCNHAFPSGLNTWRGLAMSSSPLQNQNQWHKFSLIHTSPARHMCSAFIGNYLRQSPYSPSDLTYRKSMFNPSIHPSVKWCNYNSDEPTSIKQSLVISLRQWFCKKQLWWVLGLILWKIMSPSPEPLSSVQKTTTSKLKMLGFLCNQAVIEYEDKLHNSLSQFIEIKIIL